MKYKQLSQRVWNRKVLELANSFNHITECRKCGSPTIDGYCCTFCGDTNPDQTQEEEDAVQEEV